MARLALAATLLVLAVMVAPGIALAEIAIEGTVLNKTGGESPVKGQPVELKVVRPDGSEATTLTTKTDDVGKFSFANLGGTASLTSTVSTKFQGVEYQAAVRSVPVAGAPAKTDLVVYDSTTEASIQADLSHLVVDVDPTTRDIIVTEITVLANSTDKTLVARSKDQAGGGRTLWFPLPKGALHSEVTEGLDAKSVAASDEGLAYDGPFLPGKRQVVYSYILPNSGSSLTLAKPLSYPTRKVNVLMVDVGQRLAGPKFGVQQLVNLGDRNYLSLSGDSFEAGESLQISVSDLPAPRRAGQGLSSIDELKWVTLAVFILVVGAVVAAYPRLRASRQLASAGPRRNRTGPAHEREGLLAAIANLDRQFEAGEISPEQYRQQREERKRHLRQMWS